MPLHVPVATAPLHVPDASVARILTLPLPVLLPATPCLHLRSCRLPFCRLQLRLAPPPLPPPVRISAPTAARPAARTCHLHPCLCPGADCGPVGPRRRYQRCVAHIPARGTVDAL
eukprot:19118-Chlamydomonas_euryale.AAC.7